MSYDGQIDFGLVGDYDAMADLESFGLDLEKAIAEAVSTAPASDDAQPTDRAQDSERRRVGQVVPVESAGAEAVGPGVGVYDDGGDPAEASRLPQSHRHPTAVTTVAKLGHDPAVALAAMSVSAQRSCRAR